MFKKPLGNNMREYSPTALARQWNEALPVAAHMKEQLN